MALDKNTNYIVSGVERSGTSMLMQILHAGGAHTSFDNESRPPDDNNPRGYFELEGGKIINSLMDGTFPITDYLGRFIKITAYGLKYLPSGKYKIIYSERNMDEIMDSMEKMAKITDKNREETKSAFINLNDMVKNLIKNRQDADVLFVSYNEILADPEQKIREIYDFLGGSGLDLDGMIKSVDKSLHRNRR